MAARDSLEKLDTPVSHGGVDYVCFIYRNQLMTFTNRLAHPKCEFDLLQFLTTTQYLTRHKCEPAHGNRGDTTALPQSEVDRGG